MLFLAIGASFAKPQKMLAVISKKGRAPKSCDKHKALSLTVHIVTPMDMLDAEAAVARAQLCSESDEP